MAFLALSKADSTVEAFKDELRETYKDVNKGLTRLYDMAVHAGVQPRHVDDRLHGPEP